MCPCCSKEEQPLLPAPVQNWTPEKRNGTRLPEQWMPDRETIDQMKMQFPFLTSEWFRNQHDQFVDYWHAKAGKDATKRDWNATWRNWIRRAALDMPRTNGHAGTLNSMDAKAAGWQAMKGQR